MAWVIRTWITCPSCEGCGKVSHTLHGAGILTTKPCSDCYGFGQVLRTITLNEREQATIDKMVARRESHA